MEVREYSPTDVIMTFGGSVVEGWDKITTQRINESFKIVEGIRGKNTRIRINNTAATVEITLSQTSPTNYIFSEIVRMDEEYGTGRIEVMIKDIMTGEVFSSTEAFLERPSAYTFEEDISDRVWTMHCLSSNFSIGSSSPLGSLVENFRSIF